MRIHIFYIQKSDELPFLSEKYAKLLAKYAQLREKNLFSKKIAAAQSQGANEAQKSYEEAFMPYKKGFCIVLDEGGREFSSVEFSRLIADRGGLSFFIGGAYGLGAEFVKKFDLSLALSRLTLTHHFARVLLLEQLYRAFCLQHNHPYHK
ncbi:23S rRNA (pseudouridine(1915)-N(3))-methyltransferase RlmH [Campylobacter sp.]|uniref:23S rRNA (pseudouridine(1915)-N(3))-methyltransferase RlmH n=1 Tax=Campylobacter sp. TaxID=205 RepID=UPI0026DC43D4|nr:23S rRNA (pseudouridine(1915)-N(3))-methyltransferase RlmH [Campylobacter sp.]MDO4673580.1 23S rRNA (pseudouridine(1915)-N(3))-methyltransferase RlmH [Campylobacter sp.]